MNKKRIAFCGTRGLPANYGGFETAVDEISKHFVNQGYKSDVFCREANANEKPESYEGRKLIYVKGSTNRKLDTFVSSIQTALYLFKNKRDYDYIFWFNNANFPGIFLSAFLGIPMSVNTDGLEWRREKWSFPFKAYYFISSMLISMFCKSLISDSTSIQNYYRKVFFKKTNFIPYGAPEVESNIGNKEEILSQYNVTEDKYFLQITRLEPDNLPLTAIKGFIESGLSTKGFKYLLIGYKDDTPYALDIKNLGSHYDGVNVCNAVYNKDVLTTLRENAFCYVHGNSVGGTNPALLEAMASCKRILAIDSPFSKEVLGIDLGLFFTPETIANMMNQSVVSKDQGSQLKKRVKLKYDWFEVAQSYLELVNRKRANYKPQIYWQEKE